MEEVAGQLAGGGGLAGRRWRAGWQEVAGRLAGGGGPAGRWWRASWRELAGRLAGGGGPAGRRWRAGWHFNFLYIFFNFFWLLSLARDWSSEYLDETLHLGCSSRAAEVLY
jgi:hypothetical protein